MPLMSHHRNELGPADTTQDTYFLQRVRLARFWLRLRVALKAEFPFFAIGKNRLLVGARFRPFRRYLPFRSPGTRARTAPSTALQNQRAQEPTAPRCETLVSSFDHLLSVVDDQLRRRSGGKLARCPLRLFGLLFFFPAVALFRVRVLHGGNCGPDLNG